MRRYAILPAKTLILAERATEEEAWEVHRARYGLRRRVQLYGVIFRRQRLREAKVQWKDGHLTLRASIVDPEVWMIVYTVEGEPGRSDRRPCHLCGRPSVFGRGAGNCDVTRLVV